MNLKNNLVSILNRKNYKFVIIFLSALLLFFLFYGNYNLVEGLDLKDKIKDLNKTMSDAKKSTNASNVAVWDLEANGWRSFRWENLRLVDGNDLPNGIS
jgi:cell division protein FtsL